MLKLFAALSLPEWRLHPWRQGVALLAVALGVALGLSVHLINASALAEFGGAMRSVNGTPDIELRAARGGSFGGPGFDESLYARVAALPEVAQASPVVEASLELHDARGEPFAMRVLGVDAFIVGTLAPALLPRPEALQDRLAVIDPGSAFLNPAARRLLGDTATLQVPTAEGVQRLRVSGSVAADGPPLLVMDIAGAQALFGVPGRLQRLDVRLREGADRAQVLQRLALPAEVRVAEPQEAEERMANLTRAYRVNLTVLSLVALFTGAFLVFSIQALGVARRIPQFALLGVLGLSARERLVLVLAEGAVLGLVGSAIGVALGAALAAATLRLLGGDLGGGYFQGLSPTLHWQWGAAAVFGALGLAAALLGAWVPARQAQRLAPAQALKGLGLQGGPHAPAWLGPALLLVAVGLSALPPWGDLPLGAYLGVACGLSGGILCVPLVVGGLTALMGTPRHALALLAVERAKDQRAQASVAVAGVVVSLALGVALTVMVGSFRESIEQWLQQLLPAQLYVRAAGTRGGTDVALLPPGLPASAAALPGVQRVQPQRSLPLALDAHRPAVLLLARSLPPDPSRALPLVGPVVDAPAGVPGVFASEALASLYGAGTGRRLRLPLGPGAGTEVFVRGVWRDYARQHGTVLMSLDDYRRISGDGGLSELALWLAPNAALSSVQAGLREQAGATSLEMATTAELRDMTLRMFDRSFAVTHYLQAVAIAIGLFGIAASFSAQVLARRKEFGMLAHLGMTRGQVLALVAAEGATWTGAGAALGLALGLAVSVVLVKVVNPQSFHWSMDMTLPVARLAWLCAAVLAAGTVTALLAGRSAAGKDMALAVKEDW